MTWKRWTRQDDFELLHLCETRTYAQIAEALGRTHASIKTRMRLKGLKPYCATFSFKDLCRSTGYAETQILRAKEALGQKWLKIPYSWTKRYSITQLQVDRICAYLRDEPDAPYDDRFWESVQKQEDGHWVWLKRVDFFMAQRNHKIVARFRPQRLAWLLVKGPLEPYQHVFRDCGHPRCVNPDHCHIIERRRLEAA